MKKCTDCYEENNDRLQRCSRCGRLLEAGTGAAAGKQALQETAKFEVQHSDAPNVMRTDRSVYRK